MLLYNGRIITMIPGSEIASYVTTDGRYVAEVGQDWTGFIGEVAEKLDLQGRTIMPGLIDTHMHLLGYGSELTAVNLRGCTSVAEVAERVGKRAAVESADSWIFGRGWDENCYGGVLPSRADLDKVAPENPVVLYRVCCHLLVCNTRTLQILGIDEHTPVPDGGAIDYDAQGQLTGVFRENAMDLVADRLPHRSMEEIEKALATAGESLLAQGLTTVHADDLSGVGDIAPRFELYRKLFRAGKLPKVHLHIRSEHLAQARELGIKTGDCQDGITVGAVKIFTDGSLGARTAAMLEDYSDCPGEKGILIFSDEELYKQVKAAHSADFNVAIHAIGDAATAQVMRIISRVQTEDPRPYLRHRMIHAQILNPAIIEEMARYQVIAEIQPIFINTDLQWAEKRVCERIRSSYNWRTLLEKGIKLTGSSDCPVEPVNPLFGIYSAITRKDLAGRPESGWYLEEGLSKEQALELYTLGGAYTGGEEQVTGSLSQGKVADLVLLDRPIDQVPADQIKDIRVLMTILDGKIVYSNL